MRWLEVVEVKHFEFLRLLRSLRYKSEKWKSFATSHDGQHPGYEAYANRQSAIQDSLLCEATSLFKASAEPDVLAPHDIELSQLTHSILSQKVLEFRRSKLDVASKPLDS